MTSRGYLGSTAFAAWLLGSSCTVDDDLSFARDGGAGGSAGTTGTGGAATGTGGSKGAGGRAGSGGTSGMDAGAAGMDASSGAAGASMGGAAGGADTVGGAPSEGGSDAEGGVAAVGGGSPSGGAAGDEAGGAGGAVDPCADVECQNGGECVPKSGGTFECMCVPPFDGELCEEVVDSCSPDPCENGTCVDLLPGFECECDDNFFGVNCESWRFMWLGYPLPANDWGEAVGVSADGSVVVGNARTGSSPEQPFLWTEADGFTQLGVLQQGFAAFARGVSGDGRVVVGEAGAQGDPGVDTFGFQWRSGTGVQSLGVLELGTFSIAVAASEDGRVIVGRGDRDGEPRGIVWTDGGPSTFTTPDGPRLDGVSADGNVRGGSDGIGAFVAFVPGGTSALLPLGGDDRGVVRAVSADGSTIVGQSQGTQDRAVRWEAPTPTEDGTAVLVAGGTVTEALAVNADGTVIVGHADGEAFVWFDESGFEPIGTLLEDADAVLGGTLVYATGVSADGSIVVGRGQHGSRTEAWIARLPE